MFFDTRNFDHDTSIETDVCIVGCGPAGLTLAKELSSEHLDICLLESGGFDINAEIQSLNDSLESVGDQIPPCPNYPPAQTMRARQFGGTANQWVDTTTGKSIVRYVPLEEIDFERRDWLPYSGWPITRQDLEPYYQRAQKACGLASKSYEPEDWETLDAKKINFNQDILLNRIFQFGTSDAFTKDYKQFFNQTKNISIYLYNNAYELIQEDDSKIVSPLKCLTAKGHFWVKAKHYILAAGGIENSRILLLSKNENHKNGLGNQNDLVGRFFMDHQLIRVGVIHTSNQFILNHLKLYSVRSVSGSEIQAKPILSPDLMEREKLLNANFFLLSRPFISRFNLIRTLFPSGKNYTSKAVSSAITVSRKIRKANLSLNDMEHLSNILQGLDDIIYFQARKLTPPGVSLEGYWPEDLNRQRSLGAIHVYSSAEQAPRPENRIILGDEKDQNGYSKTQIIWRWDKQSRESFVRAAKLFGKEIANAGMGKLVFEFDKGDPQLTSPSIHHHMGTTRMHDDPKQGVVDANCKVHDVANLYVAGSSVFPTGGYANPTLTIVALSIRLADHIKQVSRADSALANKS